MNDHIEIDSDGDAARAIERELFQLNEELREQGLDVPMSAKMEKALTEDIVQTIAIWVAGNLAWDATKAVIQRAADAHQRALDDHGVHVRTTIIHQPTGRSFQLPGQKPEADQFFAELFANGD